MKHFTNLLLISICAIMLFSNSTANAQLKSPEGKTFWLGMPYLVPNTARNIPLTDNSIFQLFINSKTKNTVRILSSSGSTIVSDFIINANENKIVAIAQSLMNSISEQSQANKAIRVEADEPITLSLYIGSRAYNEACQVMPVEYLGTEYYTANLFQDYYNRKGDGTPLSGIKYISTPGQILIIATENSTNVTYYPKARTKEVGIGSSNTVSLNKGDAYLILADTAQGLTHASASDLTGTFITSNNKIAVFSGHSSSTFPPMPELGPYRSALDYIRNIYWEQMLPNELLGKTHITIPFAFEAGRQYINKTSYEKGDLIRFIATKDKTEIYTINEENGEKNILKSNLNKGDYFEILEQEVPAVFLSNEPVAVFQYSKSYLKSWTGWGKSATDLESDKQSEDELQAGAPGSKGMLISITPNDRWVNYSAFTVPLQINPYLTLIFNTGTDSLIKLDGRNLNYRFSSEIKKIPNTKFSYVATNITFGKHTIESINEDVKFTAYVYGYKDSGEEDGTSYGYSPAMDYSEHCQDTILFTSNNPKRYEYNGKLSAVDLVQTEKCAEFYYIKLDSANYTNSSISYKLKEDRKEADYSVKFLDHFKDGKLKLLAKTKGGCKLDTTFTYKAPKMSIDSRNLYYYVENLNTDYSKSIKIKNTGTVDETVEFPIIQSKEMAFRYDNPEKNIILPAGQEFTINIIAKFTNTATIADTANLYLKIDGEEYLAAKLFATNNNITISSDETRWEDLKYLVDLPVTKLMKIINTTKEEVKIKSVRLVKNKKNFELDNLKQTYSVIQANNDAPFKIASGDSTFFGVNYLPHVWTNFEDKDSVEVTLVNDKKVYYSIEGSVTKTNLLRSNTPSLELPYYKLDSIHYATISISNIAYVPVTYTVRKGGADFPYTLSNKNNDLQTIPNKGTQEIEIAYQVSKESNEIIKDSIGVKYFDYFNHNISEIQLINNIKSSVNGERDKPIAKQVFDRNEVIKFDLQNNIIKNLVIYNEKGQSIYEFSSAANILMLPASDFIRGSYFYTIESNNRQITGKFIVK